MCKFFSFCTDGEGNRYYFDWIQRQKIINKELNLDADSHASIAKFFQKDEDKLNKYEYNPLTKSFVVDQINNEVNDRIQAEEWVKTIDFKKIVKPLIINEIINPFEIKAVPLSKKHKKLLKEYKEVGDSVWDSVGDSVRDSVGDSVRDSVWDSVRDSVWDSVSCYLGSFFDILHPIDITPWVDLWNDGYVPSFDGTTWRLHCGKDAKIVYEMKA